MAATPSGLEVVRIDGVELIALRKDLAHCPRARSGEQNGAAVHAIFAKRIARVPHFVS